MVLRYNVLDGQELYTVWRGESLELPASADRCIEALWAG